MPPKTPATEPRNASRPALESKLSGDSVPTLIVRPGNTEPPTVLLEDGRKLSPPAGWMLLPPGDAALTRRVKSSGPTWTVQQKKGRKIFSLGVWADAARIESIRQQLDAERSTESYARRREALRERRDRKQTDYVESFERAVRRFLHFAPQYRDLEAALAVAVTRHATPIGSGTVARTERIPIERRAESAVIAWMRHQTTAYDSLTIPRVKGKRREVRQMLAAASRRLLEAYRQDRTVDPALCPLQKALRAAEQAGGEGRQGPPAGG